MDLNKKLEELKPYQLNCNVFDVYSYNGLTMQELLCQFFTKINECITVSNETIDLAKWLVNEGLEIEVVKKLMIWLEDGTLENLINVNLFNTLNDKINGLSSQLEHNVNSLIDFISTTNPEKFGAIGDGVNDDSDAIQSAIDTNKIVVFLPNKIYYISKPLTYRENTHIIGNNSVLISDGTILKSPNLNELTENIKNVKIENVTFKTKTLGFNESKVLLKIESVDGFNLEYCKFIGWNGDAVQIDLLYDTTVNFSKLVSNNIYIIGCDFDGVDSQNRQAITIFQGTNIFIEKCSFKNTTKQGMPGTIDLEPWLYHSDMKIIQNVFIRNNIFDPHSGNGGFINIYFDKPQNELLHPFTNIVIENNVFNADIDSDNLIYFEQVDDKYRNYTFNTSEWTQNNFIVSNNVFNIDIDRSAGKNCYFTMYNCNGFKIEGNTFNNFKGAFLVGSSTITPRKFRPCINGKILNNVFKGIRSNLFHVGAIKNIEFKGNIFEVDNTSQDNIVLCNILPEVNGHIYKGLVISENIIDNNELGKIKYFYVRDEGANTTQCILSNNILDGATNI